MPNQLKFDDFRVATYRVATESPEADGTLAWDATEMVVVEIEAAGQVGLGYSYTAAKPAAALIQSKLIPAIQSGHVLDLPKHWLAMRQQLRNIGTPGLGMMAVSAVDTALWDLKAKILNVSLTSLLGAANESVAIYGSGGFTTYSDQQLHEQLQGWVSQGLGSVKIKLGVNAVEDARRVALARQAIGPETRLMVDANGGYSARGALELIEAIAPFDVCWLEEPVSSDDLAGLAWLRDRAPGGMAIAAGEYGWDATYFRHMLDAGAIDVLQADATRCGYTGFLETATLCRTYNIPLSAHCAPALHAPLCAAINGFMHQEYFHDHVRIERVFFTEGTRLERGRLYPDVHCPGTGLQLQHLAADEYRL